VEEQKLSSRTDKRIYLSQGRAVKKNKYNVHSVRIDKPANYSRFVSIMKFLLPAIALGLLGLIILWPQITNNSKRFSIKVKNIEGMASNEPNMINARFVGNDKNSQPYSITADMAKNVIIGGSSVELEMPKADISIKDGTWLAVTANSGFYNQKTKTLDLIGAVNLFHDSGYEFNSKKIIVDLNNNNAVSDVKITGQGPFGTLTAEGFRLEKYGTWFFFTGKAKLVIHQNANQ
jgi:lipopolysaccharide export system protein LptC